MQNSLTLKAAFAAKLAKVAAEYRHMVPLASEAHDPVAVVQALWDSGKTQLCQGELFQLEFFCKHLDDVRLARPDVFEELQSRAYRCATPGNFNGLRMEARIASSLVRKQLAFDYRERPDFSIDNGSACIECGSVWPDTENPFRDYRERVASAIAKKGRKGYAKPNTVLAIEITSVVAAMATHKTAYENTDFHLFLSDVVNQSGFGSVLLFNTVYSHQSGRLESSFNRIDSATIDRALVAFLEAYFARVGHRVYDPFVPGERTIFVLYRAVYRNVPKSGEFAMPLPLQPYCVEGARIQKRRVVTP